MWHVRFLVKLSLSSKQQGQNSFNCCLSIDLNKQVWFGKQKVLIERNKWLMWSQSDVVGEMGEKEQNSFKQFDFFFFLPHRYYALTFCLLYFWIIWIICHGMFSHMCTVEHTSVGYPSPPVMHLTDTLPINWDIYSLLNGYKLTILSFVCL